MNTFSKVRELVMSLEEDFEKFYDKSNQAAGTRVRKGMQELKNMATEIRKSVQDMKNTGGAAAGGSTRAKSSGSSAKSSGSKSAAGGAKKSTGAAKGGKK